MTDKQFKEFMKELKSQTKLLEKIEKSIRKPTTSIKQTEDSITIISETV